jgi:O-antigen/teichoic acid export membrane protein
MLHIETGCRSEHREYRPMRISHVSWNLLGLVLPLVVAALVIPSLLGVLGTQRFGVLALAWGLIGYASAVDLGIGRAVTQMVSKIINTKNARRESDILQAALQITFGTGAIAFGLIIFLAVIGAAGWISADEIPSQEKTTSIILLAFAIPLQSISATYRGINEAHLNFKKVSLLRVGLGIANFGAPYLISIFTVEMHWLIASLVLSRAIALVFYRNFALKLVSRKSSAISIHRSKVLSLIRIRLIRFGGWLTVSSILNPIVNSADRFLLASVISASAVTLYVIPFEMTTQSLILVGAVSTVFFPHAARSANQGAQKLKKDFLRVTWTVAAIMGCVALGYLSLGHYVLSIWLDKKLDGDSVRVLQIICLGLAPYAVASLSTSVIHSRGSSELTAIVNMLMFFPSLALLYFSIKYFGVIGASVTWLIRILLEAISFFYIALRQIKNLSIEDGKIRSV